jgi:hypothetical protein
MNSQPNNEAAKWDDIQAAVVAKRCPTDWHVAQDARDGTYYCAPTHPDAAVGQLLGHWLAIPIVIVLMLLLHGARRWYRTHRGQP